MIARSFFVAAVILALYSAGLWLYPEKWTRTGIGQQRRNVIHAEQFVFGGTSVTNLLIGTSLSSVLPAGDLGPGLRNLTFPGKGPSTGLEILLASPMAPKTVFLEVNITGMEVGQDIVDQVVGTRMATLRGAIPLLRASSQPLTLFYSWIQSRTVPAPHLSIPALLKAGLVYYEPFFNDLTLTNVMTKALDRLEASIQQLEQRGSTVILVEFPIHPQLASSPRHGFVMQQLIQRFPTNQFNWIRPDPTIQYDTTDGHHLDSAAAARFAAVLRKASQSEGPPQGERGRASQGNLTTPASGPPGGRLPEP